MVKASVQQFSTTASSNTDIDGINVNTGWPPSNVGPAFREFMALVAASLVPLTIDITGDSTLTLTAAQASAQVIQFTGALTGGCTVTYPNALFMGFAQNITTGGFNVVLTAGVGTTATVAPGGALYPFACDGATNVALSNLVGGGQSLASLLRGYISGLILSNDSGTPNSVLDIGAGTCTDSTHNFSISLGTFTKSTAGSWATGSGMNGMGLGLSVAASTWYHVFSIINSGTPDVYFDTSVTAAHAPMGTTAFRRIGSFLTDASAHILAFRQLGDTITYSVAFADYQTTIGAGTYGITITVPPGVIVSALNRALVGTSVGNWEFTIYDYESNPLSVNGNTSLGGVNNSQSGGQFVTLTTTSQQVTFAINQTAGVNIATYGYIDDRGANA